MKKVLHQITLLAIFVVFNYSYSHAQCKAFYMYSQSGKTVTFYDSSYHNSANPSFYWNFGDGNTASGQYVSHTYQNYGTYYVCHGLNMANCSDTICDSVTISAPHCKAQFKEYTSGATTYFYNSSSSISGNAKYYWDFGDNTSSTQEHPSHKYASSGNYTVCLYMTDSVGGCGDTLCQNISVSLSNGGGGGCSAQFKYYIQNGIIYFDGPQNSNGGNYSSYSWDFGDSTTSSQKSPTHTFTLNKGYLNVCLTVQDSGCSDTYCDSVYYANGGGGTCSVYFTDSLHHDTADFTSYVKGTSGTVNYSWDFGDGGTSTSANPSNYYSKPGNYYVTLTISDSACSSTYSSYIYIGSGGARGYTVMGQVNAGNSFAYPAQVWAIQYDSAAGTLTAADSTMTDSGGYYKFGLNQGYYMIKAALYPANGGSASYMPTYYIAKLTWDSATQLKVDTDLYYINISLIAGNFAGGPGFIGGKTSQGANKTNTVGDPVNQVQIVLFNSNKQPVAYTYSDANGDFKFSNIAYGTYYIHAEIPGKKSYDLQVSIDATKPSVNSVTVEVNSKYVSATLTGISNAAITAGIEVWPNPASDHLYIKSANNIANVYITDATGKQVMNISKPEQVINISSLEAGIYILQMRTKEGNLIPYRFVKQ